MLRFVSYDPDLIPRPGSPSAGQKLLDTWAAQTLRPKDLASLIPQIAQCPPHAIMRLLCRLFMISAIFMTIATDSTVASSNRSNEAAVNLLTVPPRLEANVSVTPTPLKPRGFAVEAIDHGHRNDEERVGSSKPPQSVTKALDVVRTITRILEKIRQKAVNLLSMLEVKNEGFYFKRLVRWLNYVDQFNAKEVIVGDDDVLKVLESGRTEQELVTLFNSLRDVDGMKGRADSLQRSLAVKHPEITEQMENLWLNAKVTPDEVYDMMPFAAEEKLEHDVEEATTWHTIRSGLIQWMKYAEKYNSLPDSTFDSMHYVDLLVKKRGISEVVAFSFSKEYAIYGNMRLDSRFRKALVKQYPEARELAISTWLKSDVEPNKAFFMLPKAWELDVGTRFTEEEWLTSCLDLEQWISFVDRYNAKITSDEVLNGIELTFRDKELVDFLVRNLSEKQTKAALNRLERIRGMERRAKDLQIVLALRHWGYL